MKAVVMARGLGTRMRKAAEEAELNEAQRAVAATGVKGLMPIGRHPFLDYVLSALADGGVDQACLVIGPEHHALRDHYGKLPTTRIRIAFAEQAEPRGTADAVAAAESWVGTDRFLVLNSDNLYPVEAIRALVEMDTGGIAAFRRESIIKDARQPRERIARYPVVRADEQGYLTRLEDQAASTEADPPISMNLWGFTPRIFDACRRIRPSANGELELQAAVAYAIRELGELMRVVTFALPVLDITSRADVGFVTEQLARVEVRL